MLVDFANLVTKRISLLSLVNVVGAGQGFDGGGGGLGGVDKEAGEVDARAVEANKSAVDDWLQAGQTQQHLLFFFGKIGDKERFCYL